MPARQPHQRHTIRDDQISALDRAPKIPVVPRLGNAMHSRDRNVPASSAALNPMLDPGDNVRNLHRMHRNAQDAKPKRRREANGRS